MQNSLSCLILSWYKLRAKYCYGKIDSEYFKRRAKSLERQIASLRIQSNHEALLKIKLFLTVWLEHEEQPVTGHKLFMHLLLKDALRYLHKLPM